MNGGDIQIIFRDLNKSKYDKRVKLKVTKPSTLKTSILQDMKSSFQSSKYSKSLFKTKQSKTKQNKKKRLKECNLLMIKSNFSHTLKEKKYIR